MPSKKKLLQDSKLYLILDASVNGYDQLLLIAKQAIQAGVKIVQLRDKKGTARDIIDFSRRILKITKERALYTVNDRADVALAVQADVVHMGQDDMPIPMVRKLVGRKLLVGASCQTWEQAKKAQQEGADYIGFGSVFKTQTKPERAAMDLKLLEKVVRSIKIPVFAIGGITQQKAVDLLPLGVERFAVCRCISEASDVLKVTKQFLKAIM